LAERLLATRGQVQRERRVVTILFSDVKGSTAMAGELDPEDVMEIMDAAFDVLIQPIYRYEGTLARLMGDAVLAFFGAPIAHEDDPERACRAALEIVEGTQVYAERLERERGIEDFNVRVGIHTGLVVVGEVGSDLRVEYTAMGDAINLAARMEAAAEPGTILITEDTHDLIAPLFETEGLGPVELKGRAEPLLAYRVLAAKVSPGKGRGIAGLDSPLVGRRAEFAALQDAMARLQAGVGGIVTLVGEAGIGKSRLVAELRKRSLAKVPKPSQGLAVPQWVEGRCLSYGTSIAYLLWVDALRGMLGVTAESSPVAVRDALWQEVQDLCADRLDDVYPYLGRLLSVPLTPEDEARLEYLEGEALKMGTFRAVETLVKCAATKRPLVLVCEDLHWADPTSIELLEKMLPLTDRVPLLFICAFRPETDHGCWRIKEAATRFYRHRHTDLWLDPLSARESRALVDNLLGLEGLSQKPAVSNVESVQCRILDHAGGNPFYVEEIIRSLINDGGIVQDWTTGHWQATQDAADIPISENVLGVLAARIDRLPEEARRSLQMAAVIGRLFFYRVLEAIAATEKVAWGEQTLEECLITLQREGMIRERARLPEPEYIFKHELTREAAYSGLLRNERRILHRRVAEALERLFPDRIEEQVELLAHHWEAAGEREKAVSFLLRAAERARRVGASLEAIEFYQLALQKAPQGAAQLHGIHEGLGDVYLVNLSRHEEALRHYKSFLALAESEEDLARGARKVAGVHMLGGDLVEAKEYYEAALARLSSSSPSPEASRVHFGLSFLFISKNQLDEAARHAEAGLEISRRVADTKGLADANKALGVIAVQQGDMEAACRFDERSLQLYRQLGDLPRTAQACNNVGDSYRLLGRMSRALERLNEGLEIARRIGDTRDEALLLMTMAEVFLDQGEWETAIAHLEQALPLAEESEVVTRLIEVHWIIGSAYERAQQLEDARRHLATAETLSRETQHVQFLPQIYLNLARLSVSQGEFTEAEGYIDLALEAAGPEPSDVFLGLMHRCYGYLHNRCGQWDDAVSHLEESLELLGRAGLPVEVGKTRESLATAYASRGAEGDGGRACEQLLAAQSIFRRTEALRRLAQVAARLRKLGCGGCS
jgi:class 3 adenylate cyclase/tetratricopeptide (TPR) repeat protein